MFSGLISRWTIPASCAAASALGNLQRDVQCFAELHASARQALLQRLAFDQFAHDVMGRLPSSPIS